MASSAAGARGPRCRGRGASRELSSPAAPGEAGLKARQRPVRGPKAPRDPQGPDPEEADGRGEASRSPEAEVLLRLSRGLQGPGVLRDGPDGPDTPPGGRPRRRAAKMALLYLQKLAEELTSVCQQPAPTEGPQEPQRVQRKRRRKKEEEDANSDDPTQDADFVPSTDVLLQAEEEEEEESDAALSEDSEMESVQEHSVRASSGGRSKPLCRGVAPNGFHNSIMAPVEKCSSLTCSLREQVHSQWEFPDWIPLAHNWMCLSESEAAPYLPVEEKSPLFSIQREGLEDGGALYRLNRFGSLYPHEERRDAAFFVGGPVWAMEWCPTPEGATAAQYVALYCHRTMEETHSVVGLYQGPALLQLWGLGTLQEGSADRAGLAYAIAADHGCVWDMKFCPSGAWEPPSSSTKHPRMSRLGLLAAAFSDGSVVLYALPHPSALQSCTRTQVKDGSPYKHMICKVQRTTTLRVGSIQAGSATECGQCFSLSWMPSRPHQHLAAGFYDGTVAIWNLLTTSPLQRVSYTNGSLQLYPFQCFLAHDHAVRSIEWCKANSNFLVTVGKDRKIKFWDLRRLYEPINSIKRFLSTEVAWLLPYNGVTVAQDNCYASYGLCGIHYIDAGYLGYKAYFVAPRKGTVWSISGSDWLNTVAAGDITGELVAAVLPDLAVNPLNVKRSSDRRFPVYKADLQPCSPAVPGSSEPVLPRTRHYSEMVATAYVRFRDTDLRSFKNFPSREPMRRMHKQEGKAELSLDRLQLEALHKVRFSPNLDVCGWLVSGGQAGIVRLHCLAGLAAAVDPQLLPRSRARYSSQPSPPVSPPSE